MTRRQQVLAGGAGLALTAALVVTSGVISIKASSGHMAVTSWILDFAKRRSVDTRSLGTTVPDLEAPGLAALGAAHFDRGCRPCHGAPGAATPVIPLGMTPHPPDLAPQIARWKPRELFYIVAHGIKFTGMPGWPVRERTDEAWALVAFLRRLPTLDAASYAALAGGAGPAVTGAPEDLDTVTARCAACHGAPARGRRSPLVPALAGQHLDYVVAALDAYATGGRKSGMMRSIAAPLDGQLRAAVAARLVGTDEGSDPGGTNLVPTGSDPGASGGAPGGIVWQGDPSRDIPACVSCHGPGAPRHDARFPVLAGQSADYLRLQLQLFAENRRGGSSYGDIMRAIATRLTPAQIDEAARAYAALAGGVS